jgi:undecaprenyl-diphosphatase
VEGLVRKSPLSSPDAVMGWMIAAGTVPIVVLGLLFKKDIETTLRSLYVIAATMIGLALVLMTAEFLEKKRVKAGVTLRSLEKITWRDAIVIGFAQAVALIPGSSRSGVTITGGLFMGLNRETAARFSFLLSLPSVFAAGVFELVKQRHELLSIEVGAVNLITATIVSGIVGYLSIGFLLGYLKKHTTYLFIGYRLIVGGALLVLLSAGILLP